LPLTPSGGGAFAANYHAYKELEGHNEARYAGSIQSQPDRFSSTISKLRRKILHLPGKFSPFSPSCLRRNAEEVDRTLEANDEMAFFRAITPWTHWKPDRPYAAYCDVGFHTFFHNTFSPKSFLKSDLERIWDSEKKFLESANAVFFESQWGLEQTRTAYGLPGTNFFYAGRGGVIPTPDKDCWPDNSLRLVTSAKNFKQKGGDLVAKAFDILKPEIPDLTWSILGGEPDFDWSKKDGVTYEGFLDPQREEEMDKMTDVLSRAFLFLHPTREDINPLVITEAAYFGCPSISVRKFALPELIQDGTTGLLIDPPIPPEAIAESIRLLISDPEGYRAMRKAAREFALKTSTWKLVGERMSRVIDKIQH